MNNQRNCDGCTECCKWLVAESHGHHFQPGRPCHFKGEHGCTIYDDRPSVCQEYKCEWLINNDLPEWMKPTLSGVIVTRRKWSLGEYLEILETDRKIDSEVLNWFFIYHLVNNIPMRIQVSRGWTNYGPIEFRQEIINQKIVPSL